MSAVLTAGGGLTAGDRSIITAINTGASSLSFVGSAFIVLCYCLFKELRKFSFKLVFYLALSVSFPLLPFADCARSRIMYCFASFFFDYSHCELLHHYDVKFHCVLR